MIEYTHWQAFLLCSTPDLWLQRAQDEIPLLLIDHAHCEKKAAATAMQLLFRYVDHHRLLQSLTQLAREELLHFQQVLDILNQRGIAYRHLSPAQYAQSLRQHISTHEPHRLVDTLIVGALIEARSCERFHSLIPYLEPELAKYYRFLERAEARHFSEYLQLAQLYNQESNDYLVQRLELFRQHEQQFIESPDPNFRFHSGIPA